MKKSEQASIGCHELPGKSGGTLPRTSQRPVTHATKVPQNAKDQLILAASPGFLDISGSWAGLVRRRDDLASDYGWWSHLRLVLNPRKLNELKTLGWDGGVDLFKTTLRHQINLPAKVAHYPSPDYLLFGQQMRGWHERE